MIIFNLILGKDPKYTTLGVVNNEVPEGIRSNVIEFCRNYDQGCFSNWTSCKYLNLFPESEIHWVRERNMKFYYIALIAPYEVL
jgi:hypothetical protein